MTERCGGVYNGDSETVEQFPNCVVLARAWMEAYVRSQETFDTTELDAFGYGAAELLGQVVLAYETLAAVRQSDRSADEGREEKNDSGAGLIGQVASPLAETEPRPNCTERFKDADNAWCSYCAIPWRVRIVNPPGGCLESTCHQCGRGYTLAVTSFAPEAR